MVAPETSSRLVSRVAMLAALALIGFMYVRQAAETRRMREENEALKRLVESAGVTQAESAPKDAPVEAILSEPATTTKGAEPSVLPASAEIEPELIMTPTGLAAPPRNDGLQLTGAEAFEVAGGIRAVLKFNPTITEPVGIIALVIRVPRNGSARIMDINPAGSLRYAEVAKRVAEDGKFAVYQMNADVVEDLSFELTVSEPVVAEVRGTAGIGSFDFSIQPGNAIATPK